MCYPDIPNSSSDDLALWLRNMVNVMKRCKANGNNRDEDGAIGIGYCVCLLEHC